MAKRVKIFETGKHNGRDFSMDEVKKIFGNVTGKVKGLFGHTSKYAEDGIDPPHICDFSDITVEETGKVFADIEFNEKGKVYEEDKAFKGISVEIPGDNLTNIALLGRGIKPAVHGAEYAGEEKTEVTGIIEFQIEEYQKEEIMTAQEVMSAISNNEFSLEETLDFVRIIGGTIKKEHKKAFNAIAWEYAGKTQEVVKEHAEFAGVEIEIKEPEKQMTPEEIRADERAKMRAEFAAEQKEKDNETWKNKFMEDNKHKIPPSIKPLVEFALEEAINSDEEIIEFSADEKVTKKDKLVKVFEKLKGVEFQEVTEINPEFQKEEVVEIKRENYYNKK